MKSDRPKKNEMTTMKTLIAPQNSVLTILHTRCTLIFVALTLGAFALASAQTSFGVVPAPDGGYPNGNTAEGDNALLMLTSGQSNTAIGLDALSSNTTGSNNTASGFAVLLNNTTASDNTGTGFQALEDNMTGSSNTASGSNALFRNTTGSNNTADGADALTSNTIGHENTANGVDALFGNTIGSFNTADGFQALSANTTGSFNTANGAAALQNNTAGSSNTAAGTQALNKNLTGSNNTADGFEALFFNTTGFENAATGWRTLFRNTTGFHNTADGFQALSSNTTGNHNTADGDIALLHNTTGNFNTAAGAHTLVNNTTGSFNIAVGINSGNNLTTGNNNIDIGNGGVVGESATTRIGTTGTQARTFIAGVSGVAVAGSTVVINTSGQLGVAVSSERFKSEIKRMDKASEAILRLRPVTFRYKKNLDPNGVPQFGLVAEDVARVNPDLVVRDAKGDIYTVRYEAVNAMLLNEFLKEHKTVTEQQASIAELKATCARQEKEMKGFIARLEEQAAQLQKVSTQIELAESVPQMALNHR
jgi:trimeric autotransporter adhesin